MRILGKVLSGRDREVKGVFIPVPQPFFTSIILGARVCPASKDVSNIKLHWIRAAHNIEYSKFVQSICYQNSIMYHINAIQPPLENTKVKRLQ